MAGDRIDDVKQTYTVGEAAEVLGISAAYAYRLARRGELPGAFRVGAKIRVSRAVVDGLVAGGLRAARARR